MADRTPWDIKRRKARDMRRGCHEKSDESKRVKARERETRMHVM